MSLTFDEATHRYFWNGTEVPSVTTVLRPLTDFSMIPADKLEIARQRGVAVHKMVELDAKGDLDEDALPEWLRPVLIKWRLFLAESGFKLFESEHRVFSRRYNYAGTFDLFGELRGHYALIDVKRSFFAGPVIGMQTAAYSQAFAESEGDDPSSEVVRASVRRYALRLNEIGPYRLEPYTNKYDFQNFLTALNFFRLKEKCK